MNVWRTGLVWMTFLMAVACGEARGHSLYVFATGEGTTIKGRVYYRGGEAVTDAEVRITAVNGTVIQTIRSDERGEFQATVPYRCDYTVLATTADGHQAQWQVSAEELSPELPPLPTDGAETAKTGGPLVIQSAATAVPETSAAQHRMSGAVARGDALASELAGVKAQVAKLREEWQAFRTTAQVRDILGGIGFILGVTGIAFYLMARKQR